MLKGIGEYRNIPIQSIYYFEVFQRIITVHYDNNEQFEFYSSIGKLEITVLPKDFYEYIAPILYQFLKLKHLILHH